MTRFKLHIDIEQWPLAIPLHITGYSWDTHDALVVRLEADGIVGRGEAAGVYYRGETVTSIATQLEARRSEIEAGLDLDAAQRILSPGGARNALDCALWDFRAKSEGRPVWEIAGIEKPRPLLSNFTCGADTPARMAATAKSYSQARAIKLKLTGSAEDGERVQAVREARPDVRLSVDANQGFTIASLEQLMPVLVAQRVAVIEQPLPVGSEALLDGFGSPIPIAADESVQSLSDIPAMAGRFSIVNIKLDKCGGLTEGLAMAQAIRQAGLEPMIGCMLGTSLAMAPAFILGQLCKVVELDGPICLKQDRAHAVDVEDGLINCPEDLWGYP